MIWPQTDTCACIRAGARPLRLARSYPLVQPLTGCSAVSRAVGELLRPSALAPDRDSARVPAHWPFGWFEGRLLKRAGKEKGRVPSYRGRPAGVRT